MLSTCFITAFRVAAARMPLIFPIIGHSECRIYYGETFEILKQKVTLALENKLRSIFCIGETKDERQAGKQNDVVKVQLEGSVFQLSADEFSKIVIAYEPAH